MTSPGASANPSVAGGVVRHVVTGEITDVDRNSGRVDIRASDGSKVQVILPPLAVATTNKGDRASIDVTVWPGALKECGGLQGRSPGAMTSTDGSASPRHHARQHHRTLALAPIGRCPAGVTAD